MSVSPEDNIEPNEDTAPQSPSGTPDWKGPDLAEYASPDEALIALPPEEGISQDAEIGALLELVELYGPKHPAVTEFLAQHSENSEIKAWSEIVDQLSAKGLAASRKRLVALSLRAIAVMALPLALTLAVYGVVGFLTQTRDELIKANEQHNIELTQTRNELTKTNQERGRAVERSALLLRDLQAKEKELHLYANAKEELDKMRGRVDQAETARQEMRKALVTAKQQAEEFKLDSARIAKERDHFQKELANSQASLNSLKANFEKQWRNDPSRNALLTANCSRIVAVGMPRSAPAVAKLWESAYAGFPEGDNYARAILYDYKGERERYKTELDRAARDKDNPWRRLAVAELESSRGNPEVMIKWLGDLEEMVNTRDSKSTSYLLAQQQVSQQALVRLHRKRGERSHFVEALADAAKNPEEHTSLAAVAALGFLGPDAKPALPPLISALESPSPLKRWYAACTLAEIGPAARSAVPILRRISQFDRDDAVRTQAAKTLQRIEARGTSSREESR